MKLRLIYLESVFLFLLGALLCLMGGNRLGPGALNFIIHSGLWAERSVIIAQVFVAYGIILFGMACFSLFLAARGQTLTARLVQGLKQAWLSFCSCWAIFKQFYRESGRELFWPLIALGLGAGVRVYFLSQPMRGDESYTFLNFANKDLLALFDYQVPNNHVLHTLFVKSSILILGASPVSIRFPAFLMGLLTIPLVFGLARALNPEKHSGVLAAIITAVFPYVILYSSNARGYTLIMVLTLLAAFVSLRMIKNPTSGKIILLALISAMGMFTIPSMLVGVAGMFCWLVVLIYLIKHHNIKNILKATLLFGALSGIFCFILYSPVIVIANGIQPIVANQYVESLSWPGFFANFWPQMQKTLVELTRDVPLLVLVFGLIFGLAGLLRAIRSRNWEIALLLPGLLVGAVFVMFLQRTVLYSRAWIFALPFIFIVVDYGFCALLEKLTPQIQWLTKIFLVCMAIAYAGYLMSADIISHYPDTSAFPEAQLAAEYLRPILTEADAVHVTDTADWPFYFYCWYYKMPQPAQQTKISLGKTYILVKKSRYSIDQMTNQPVIKLLDIDNMALYQEVQSENK